MKNLNLDQTFDLVSNVKIQEKLNLGVKSYTMTDSVKRIDISRDTNYTRVCDQIDELYQSKEQAGILVCITPDNKKFYIHRYGPVYHIFETLEQKK